MEKKRIITLLTATAIVATSVTGCGHASATSINTAPTAIASEESASTDAYYEYCEEPAKGYSSNADYDSCEESYKEDSTATNDPKDYIDQIYDYNTICSSYNTEEYTKLEEQGYKTVLNSPLSTFSADVDTASYSNMRRMINDGYGIYDLPQDSIRIEELVNYFNYDYSDPVGSEPFGVNATISECPWNSSAKLVSIGLKTEDIDFEETPASNLVFLIDVSGSMNDYDKLPLLKEAFCMLTDQLTAKDRVSIVTYAGSDTVVLRGVSGDKTRKIKNAISDLDAGGSTNGSDGIITAYEIAKENFIKGGNNRVILATDGDLNVGLTSTNELEKLISKEKESGVFLSVIGFGTGNIKDNKMETLADKGNGNYAYIDSVKEAKKVLVDEISAGLLTVCKDVKFQVEFNPAVVAGYRQIGYSNRAIANRDFNDDTKDGGEIGAGHEVTVLYELMLNDNYFLEAEDVDVDNLRYADEFKKAAKDSKKSNKSYLADKNTELLTLNVRYKKPSESTSNLLTYPITFNSYTTSPSDDFIFQSAVAEFGLIASNSEYAGDADIDNVVNSLRGIRLNDEYKEEFLDLVKEAGNTGVIYGSLFR